MDDSWVKLYRRVSANHFLMHDDNAFNVFIKLLLSVNRKGEIAAGRRQLADLFNKKDRTLYDILIRLENNGMITITSNQKYSVIRINNWAKFQEGSNRGPNRRPTAKPTAPQRGLFDEVPTGLPTTTQPQPNHNPTTTQHSNKKEELRIKNSTNVLVDSKNPRKPDISDLFYILVKELGFTDQVKFTDGRKVKLRNRLKSFKPSQMLKAAKAIGSDPYMQGENDSNRRYGDIDYLLRNDEQIDKWIQKADVKMNNVGGF